MSRAERARIKMLRRRRRTVLLTVLLLTCGLLAVKLIRDPLVETAGANGRPSQTASTKPPSSPPPASPSPTPSKPPEVVEQGNGEWTYAEIEGEPQIHGDGAQLLSFNVAVEGETGQDATDFAAAVTSVLFEEKQGWLASGDWQFQQVGEMDYADFTVYLASPGTRNTLCESEDRDVSCQIYDRVVINLERWLLGVEHWTAGLDTYRDYVVNHEVGHRLGEGHVVCGEEGALSPVMAQQTIKLGGCEPNAWPYVDGEYITGPVGEYE